MTREEIKNFNYRAFIILAKQNREIADEIKKQGFVIHDTESNLSASELNGRFKQTVLKVYKDNIESNPQLSIKFKQLCNENPIIKPQRHFIIVGNNNFWCSNVSIDEDKDIKEELKKEFDSLGETLDVNNIPDEYFVYETISKDPL